MEPTTPPDSGSVAAAAAAAVAPDPQTAELLVKYESGQKLTPQQYGRIGALKAGWKRLIGGGNPDASPGSPQPGLPARNAPPLAAVAQDQASGAGLEPVPIDAALAQRTAAAILNRLDPIAVRWMERHAKAAGATGETFNRLVTSAALPKDDKRVIIDLAPDICAELGIDVKKFPIWTAVGVLGLHATNLWLAVGDLKELAAEREKARKQSTPETPAAAPTLAATAPDKA